MILYDYARGANKLLIYEKIDLLLLKKQINRKQMCIETDIPYSTYSNMHSRKSESISMKAIVRIAKFFNVTVDYLMRDDLPIEPILYKDKRLSSQDLPKDKLNLINVYDKLNSQGKEKAIERIEELTYIPKYVDSDISNLNNKSLLETLRENEKNTLELIAFGGADNQIIKLNDEQIEEFRKLLQQNKDKQ